MNVPNMFQKVMDTAKRMFNKTEVADFTMALNRVNEQMLDKNATVLKSKNFLEDTETAQYYGEQLHKQLEQTTELLLLTKLMLDNYVEAMLRIDRMLLDNKRPAICLHFLTSNMRLKEED